MSDKYELTWIDVNAEVGPLFKLGRDVYERERPGERLIRLKAVESYPGSIAPAAVEAFTECARAWGAPVVYVIEPNLAKPPAAKFLFEWSRTTHGNGSVEQCFLKTTNLLTRWMGRVVLKLFTDGSMPFEAIEGESALQARLNTLDLSCPQEGFEIVDPGSALVLHSEAPPSMMRSILRRAARRLRLR
jgi:hypothetical protein